MLQVTLVFLSDIDYERVWGAAVQRLALILEPTCKFEAGLAFGFQWAGPTLKI